MSEDRFVSYSKTISVKTLETCLACLLLAAGAPAQRDVEEWTAELLQKKDDADVALIAKVAATRTPAAAEGLSKAYDAMSSLLMRLEIVGALPAFDGVPRAEQTAFEKLAHIAVAADDEVREAAIAALGRSKRLGKKCFVQIVDSEVPDNVREAALRAHVEQAAPEDAAWYRHLWNPKNERRKYADGTVQGLELNAIRQLAFAGVVAHLTENEIVETLRTEPDPKIRRAALTAMHERDLPRTNELAAWVLDRVDLPGADRAEAARILAERQGARVVPTFLELAKKRDVTQEDLREEMARLIAGLDDALTNKKLVRLIGTGKPHERSFALLATKDVDDPKLLAVVRKELKNKEFEVRRAAARVLGERRDQESVQSLRDLFARPRAPQDRRIAIDAICAIEGRNPGWLAELVTFTAHADRDVRNAALAQLVAADDARHLPALLRALEHPDWATRLIAVPGVAATRDKTVVPALIERLAKEQGRLAKEISAALWRLTGQPFDEEVASWRTWWKAEGAAFEVITPAALAKAEAERERRRKRDRTRTGAQFFGIRLESHRVIFIIDTSGSMLESVNGQVVGKRGASRIDVAKRELSQCITNLDQGALFNVLAFSSGIGQWLKSSISDSSEKSREAALTWVERLGAAGPTNLFDSLKLAFEDQEVDTIFLLSDGEPTAGEILDPHRIREEVRFWNQHRGVRIHTIAIGGTLEVLEWLAKDSGGNHLRIR